MVKKKILRFISVNDLFRIHTCFLQMERERRNTFKRNPELGYNSPAIVNINAQMINFLEKYKSLSKLKMKHLDDLLGAYMQEGTPQYNDWLQSKTQENFLTTGDIELSKINDRLGRRHVVQCCRKINEALTNYLRENTTIGSSVIHSKLLIEKFIREKYNSMMNYYSDKEIISIEDWEKMKSKYLRKTKD